MPTLIDGVAGYTFSQGANKAACSVLFIASIALLKTQQQAAHVRKTHCRLEPVHLNLVLSANAFIDEDGGNLLALVAGQLDNFAEIGVIDDRTVAGKVLLEGLQDALWIKRPRKTLNSGERLTARALLDADI